jgi:Ca2+-binding EF-hand superfamily protein
MSNIQARVMPVLAKFALPALLLVGAVAVVAVFSSHARAQEQGLPSFDTLDKDKDGLVTATEARSSPAIAARFAEADKNQDGFLSRAEFNSIARP